MRYGKWEVVCDGRVFGLENAYVSHESRAMPGAVWYRTVLKVGKRNIVVAKSSVDAGGRLPTANNCPVFAAYMQLKHGQYYKAVAERATAAI